jgi:hypothetical protein
MDLPQLGDERFRRALLPWHVLILLDAIRHISSRTTSVGLDEKMEDWRRYCKEQRPRSWIGQNFPIQLHNSGGASSPSLAKEAENSSLK